MTGPPQIGRERPRGRRTSFRRRLTFSFAAIAVGCGLVLITIVYVLLANLATYAITSDSFIPVTDPGASAGSIATDTTGPFHIDDRASLLHTVLWLSLMALIVMAAVGAFSGALVARRVVRPIEAIGAVAAAAERGQLDRRVDLDGPDDELQALADTFDGMLDALQQSMAGYERFAANASHELRSPIATTQTLIDVALADPDATVDDLRLLIERLRRINARNLTTVDAILDLSEIQHVPRPSVDVDLSEIVSDVVVAALPSASAASVELTSVIEPGVAVEADPALVRQGVSNLISNAIRHNVVHGTAVVRVEQRAAGPTIVVTNTGRLIDPLTVDALREPFVRTEGRSVGFEAGRGLGLAIVHAIAEALHGDLRLEALPGGGLEATFSFGPPHDGHRRPSS